MCNELNNIIKTNKNGQLSFCRDCKKFNLTFNNILIELTPRELNAFQAMVKDIDVEYWESQFSKKHFKRNIPITTSLQNLILVFDLSEFLVLKELIFNKASKKNSLISLSEIDYDLTLN